MVTVAAAFSTGSAINSTLFGTARLAAEVARDGELPAALEHRNENGIPDRAVIGLGTLAAVLAVLGSLGTLVEAASLAFLFTFTIVCGLAFRQRAGARPVTGTGALAGICLTGALLFRLVRVDPVGLVLLTVVILVATIGRPILLRHMTVDDRSR
jgi:hypothetical protein